METSIKYVRVYEAIGPSCVLNDSIEDAVAKNELLMKKYPQHPL